jgi:pyridoxine 4-dehydrogenase
VSVSDIERARRHVPIASVQNRYNVLDREWESVVEYCDRHNIAFIPWFPLGAGKLGAQEQTARDRVDTLARRRGVSALQIALAWLLARSRMMLPIPGTSKVKHLEENVESARVTLSPDELRELDIGVRGSQAA